MELKIGGVPEHFNLPWHLAIKNGSFKKMNLSVQWKDYPGGTGAQCQDLRNGSLDVAVLLTEGIVSDIIKGNPSKIVQIYVNSPLSWGIHVPAHSPLRDIPDIKGKRYAISRMGSGSHLMAFVDAKLRGWKLSEDQLVIVNNLEGAREALKNNKAEIFMWEKFMTKPYVDSGEFRRIGERDTPWPCFVIAVREEILEKYPEEIRSMQKVIQDTCKYFMNDPGTPELVSSEFKLRKEDAAIWFGVTKWSLDSDIPDATLELVMNMLNDCKIIDEKVDLSLLRHKL